jgi:hypothetical protein
MVWTGPITQLCYLVRNVEESANRWATLMKAGPFFKERSLVPEYSYRGRLVDVDVTTAMGYCGAMQIELLQLNDDTPSVFKEGWDARGEGLHHVLIESQDFDADVARYTAAGCELAQYKQFGSLGRNGFVDAVKFLGFYVEILQSGPGSQKMVEIMQTAHRDWDGTDPIRQMPKIAY